MNHLRFAACSTLALLVLTAVPVQAAPRQKAAVSEKSKACSTEADTKGLHGKARKHFRSACMKGKPTT